MPKKKNFPPESARDDWVRMTLRLPPQLHRAIASSAGALSMNAAIVQRLRQSFVVQDMHEMVKEAHEMAHDAMNDTISTKKGAAEALIVSNDIVEAALSLKEKAWSDGFKEGQAQSFGDIKTLIEQTVDASVRKALKDKL